MPSRRLGNSSGYDSNINEFSPSSPVDDISDDEQMDVEDTFEDEDVDDEDDGEGDEDEDEDEDEEGYEGDENLLMRPNLSMPLLENFIREYRSGNATELLNAFRPARITPRVNPIIDGLSSHNDSEILATLNGLCSSLLLPSEAFLWWGHSSRLTQLTRQLVYLLGHSDNIDIQLMAVRSMSRLIDAELNNTVPFLVEAGLIPVLLKRFENVMYIDLIEQLVNLVNPVASAEPKLVLESGCLLPCIGALDFFNEYVQRQIMSAVDLCTREVNPSNVHQAELHLIALPMPPSDVVMGCLCSLVSVIAQHNPDNIENVVSTATWETLISHIQPNGQYLSKVLRAAGFIVGRRPDYVDDIGTLAETVTYALVQTRPDKLGELYALTKLMTAPKDRLFSSLKLFQVILPLPSPIDGLNAATPGLYRKKSPLAEKLLSRLTEDQLIKFSSCVIPLATSILSVSLNERIRQLSLLVITQCVSALRSLSSPQKFTELMRKWNIVELTAQLLSECVDNVSLASGALEIAWELAQSPEIINDLASGVSGDLDGYINIMNDKEDGEAAKNDSSKSPLTSSPLASSISIQNLKELVSQMASRVKQAIENIEDNSSESCSKIIADVLDGKQGVDKLRKLPLANLIKAGFLDSLADCQLEKYFSEDLVQVLLWIVTRLERFQVLLTGAKIESFQDILAQNVNLRLAPKQDSANSRPGLEFSVNVYAFATLKSLENFLKNQIFKPRASQLRTASISTEEITDESNQAKFGLYLNNKRVPLDTPVLKVMAKCSDDPKLTYKQLDPNENSDDEEEFGALEEKDYMSDSLKTALDLLKRLAYENQRRGVLIPWEKFRSAKITARLTLQLTDVVAITASVLPSWAFRTVRDYPFLYPLKVRINYIQLSSMGLSRSLSLIQQRQEEWNDDDDDFEFDSNDLTRLFGRHKRQKFRLSRSMLLEATVRMLEKSSSNPAVVEVMFFGEEGTGKGPTQEFFALASQELSSPDTNMWKDTPGGLFPAPNQHPSSEILRYFTALGMLIARALLDNRVLDFRLNPAFFEAVITDKDPSIDRLTRLDPELAATLQNILDSTPKDIESMGLDFTMPGTNDDLLPFGSEIPVTKDNYVDYVRLVCDYTLGSGIRAQINAFILGFDKTIPISVLKCFMTDELSLLCGYDEDEDWSVEALRNAITADHGYRIDSGPVQDFIEVLSKLSHTERRLFLKFATGSPKLPVGGFSALVPPLTVVIKHPDNEELVSDIYLPSVMTCAHYFKLPAYTNKTILLERLRTAIREGADSFPLS